MEDKKRPIRISASSPDIPSDLDRSVTCQQGLPICDVWDELVKAVRENQVILVSGETGSGKTTQLPKICLVAGRGRRGMIGCCQPRRIAAISVAKRVQQELGPPLKDVVGFQIRFTHRLSSKTRIKFMTDGILLAEVQRDPFLYAYDTIILDEAHERSINIDLISGVLKGLLKKRKDLKAIITSATMEVEKFLKFFDDPPLIKVPGRSFPVEILHENENWYEDFKETVLEEKVLTCCQMIRRTDPYGDILVFLPTEKHIFNSIKLLKRSLKEDCELLPLFGRLPASRQAQIFRPSKKQKIILSTNIAETSITVPGIRYVIDSGLSRISRYNVNTHLKSLPIEMISKASAMQRAGRAGRVQKGLCIRLYSQEKFLLMDEFLPPEIKRCNLSEVILKILNMGLGPAEDFPFMDPPRPAAIKEGLHTLLELGAVDKKGKLTRLGRKMARLPLDPRLSRIIFQAKKEECVNEILPIVSALSIQDIWVAHENGESQGLDRKKSLMDESSDFFTILKVWRRLKEMKEEGASRGRIRKFCQKHLLSYQRIMEWQDIYNQIVSICRELKIIKKRDINGRISCSDLENNPALRDLVHRSVLAGFLGHAAQKKAIGAGYLGAKGKELFIFPASSLFKKGPQWIVSAEQVRTSRSFARTVAPIKPEWIEEFAPHLCKYHFFEPIWDSKRGEATVKERVNFYGMTIIPARRRSLKSVDRDLARKILIQEGLSTCDLKFEYPFKRHNRAILEELEEMEQRRRSPNAYLEMEVLFDFFEKALSKVEKRLGRKIYDEHGLRAALRRDRSLDRILRLDRDILLRQAASSNMERLYPGSLNVDGQRLPLTYRFDPGNKDDGIVVQIPLVLLPFLEKDRFDWLVPGFLQEKIALYLKNLPKKLRKRLEPLDEKAALIVECLDFGKGSLKRQFLSIIREKFEMELDTKDLLEDSLLPSHLSMTFEIVDKKGNTLKKGKDLLRLKKGLYTLSKKELDSWTDFRTVAQKIEGRITPSDLSRLPGKIEIGAWGGTTVFGFPGITIRDNSGFLAIFLSRSQAHSESQKGLGFLMESQLKKEIRHLKNMLHQAISEAFSSLIKQYPFDSKKIGKEVIQIKELAFSFQKERHFPHWAAIPDYEEFQEAVLQAKKGLLSGFHAWLALFEPVLFEYVELRLEEKRIKKARGKMNIMASLLESVSDMRMVVIQQCLSTRSHEQLLKSASRYLKALRLRLVRAENAPNKDAQKLERFKPTWETYLKILQGMEPFATSPSNIQKAYQELQIQVFEFMVSVFAPELSIRNRFSQKKLSTLLAICQKGL